MNTIDLMELFKVQRKLDAEIERKHPSMDGEDRLSKRILALQVELGECANEWRGFKFWSNRQTANTLYQTTCDSKVATHYYCETCKKDYNIDHGLNCDGILYPMRAKNPLLEEYVDCFHFVLSIGLELGFEKRSINRLKTLPQDSIIDQYLEVTNDILELYYALDFRGYENLITSFLELGETLGFTWKQIETAYMDKNQINWQRQETGY